jgi:hypothetical protein
MAPLPDDALVVRGGMNLTTSFVQGSGVTIQGGILQDVSVNSASGLAVDKLTASNQQTGYPGILNNQVGVCTVGKIRALGGEVIPSPTRSNPFHATLSGLSAEQASSLFRPTLPNPNRKRK